MKATYPNYLDLPQDAFETLDQMLGAHGLSAVLAALDAVMADRMEALSHETFRQHKRNLYGISADMMRAHHFSTQDVDAIARGEHALPERRINNPR